ncbi:MAG: outer membrane protein assembly factor BamA [bacterium]
MLTRTRAIPCAFLLILFLAGFVQGAQQGIPVRAIEIRGNRIIEEATIRHQIRTKVGTPFSPFLVRKDIANIYTIGYIDDIRVESEPFEGGIRLIYWVREKPWIKGIIFEGNEEIKDDTLKEKLGVKEKTFLDKGAIAQGITALMQHYYGEGFYLAAIDHRIEEVEEGWVNLHVVIQEGKKVRIRRVVFSGNEHFSDRTLRKQVITRPHGLFSFLTKKGFLNRDVLEEDRIRLQNFYLDRGFIHCRVSSPTVEFDEHRRYLTITFPIEEGERYTVKEVSVAGNNILTTEALQEMLLVKPGDVYSRSEISRDITRITDAYGEKGYLTSEVFPGIAEDTSARTVSVAYKIREGSPSFLRWIDISGNTKTRDKVIRREMLAKEGDLLDTGRMRESYRRIRTLGFFEEMDLKTTPTRVENQFDLEITVAERLTGQISLGAGYSSEEHVVGTFEITQGNLFGRGQRLSASAEMGGERQTYNISFTEPYFMDKPLLTGFRLYYDIKEYDRYTRSSRGGDVHFGFPLPLNFRYYTEYTYEKVNIYDIEPAILEKRHMGEDLTLFERSLLDAEGLTYSSSLLVAFSRDTRDDRFRPTSGSMNRLAFKYAGGFLGGDNWFYTANMDSGWYAPLPWWKFVLALHGNLAYASGHGDRDLPVFERLYCGGTNTVRGYQQRSIGPLDWDGNPTGGNKRAVFNLEVHFPIYEAMGGLVFFDAGNVFDEETHLFAHSLRMSVGMGMRIFTPIGPMRLDWGHKLLRRPDETAADWHFAIGTYF